MKRNSKILYAEEGTKRIEVYYTKDKPPVVLVAHVSDMRLRDLKRLIDKIETAIEELQ